MRVARRDATVPDARTVALIVIAKEPVAGAVKTRLCPPCDPEEAALIALTALQDTLAAVGSSTGRDHVLALDGRPGSWVPPGFRVAPQRGHGLAERIAAAFEDVGGPALLVGMDTPQVRPNQIDAAVRALLRPGVDAVLGPAEDGGWWAIGLRNSDPRVFEGVPMSTPRTGARQAQRLNLLGLRWSELQVLRDVDGFEDALDVAASVPGSRFAAAVASAALRILAPAGASARW